MKVGCYISPHLDIGYPSRHREPEQENCYKFDACLGYMVNSRSAWTIE